MPAHGPGAASRRTTGDAAADGGRPLDVRRRRVAAGWTDHHPARDPGLLWPRLGRAATGPWPRRRLGRGHGRRTVPGSIAAMQEAGDQGREPTHGTPGETRPGRTSPEDPDGLGALAPASATGGKPT